LGIGDTMVCPMFNSLLTSSTVCFPWCILLFVPRHQW
jgi:hypothetical protein